MVGGNPEETDHQMWGPQGAARKKTGDSRESCKGREKEETSPSPKEQQRMLKRLLRKKISPWGVGLGVLLTGLVEVEAQPPGGSTEVVVDGTVSGPQGPLPEGGATVILTLIREGADQEWSEEQSLQPNGYFLFPEVPPGSYSLRILAEGFDERVLHYLIVREESTNHWDLKVPLQSTVQGRIFKADGTPLVDTEVEFQCCWLIVNGRSFEDKRVTTDGEGRYELRVEEEEGMGFQVVLMHPGEGYAVSPVLPYVSKELQKEVDLRLFRGYSLSGVVRDAETHTPIPDLELLLQPVAYLLDIIGRVGRKGIRWPSTTDATGGFIFPNLAPGIYELSVGFPLGPYLEKKRVLVQGEKGDTTISVDWELPRRPCPSLTLQLRLPDGSPAAHTPVDLQFTFSGPRSARQLFFTSHLRTDDQGQLQLPLSTGEGVYHGTLTIEGYPPVTVENIWVFGEGPVAELEITFQ